MFMGPTAAFLNVNGYIYEINEQQYFICVFEADQYRTEIKNECRSLPSLFHSGRKGETVESCRNVF